MVALCLSEHSSVHSEGRSARAREWSRQHRLYSVAEVDEEVVHTPERAGKGNDVLATARTRAELLPLLALVLHASLTLVLEGFGSLRSVNIADATI